MDDGIKGQDGKWEEGMRYLNRYVIQQTWRNYNNFTKIPVEALMTSF